MPSTAFWRSVLLGLLSFVHFQFSLQQAGGIECAPGDPKFYLDSQGRYIQPGSWKSLCAKRRFGGNTDRLAGYCALWLDPKRLLFDSTVSSRADSPPPINLDYLCHVKCYCSPQPRFPQNEWPAIRDPATTEIITVDGYGTNTGRRSSGRSNRPELDSAYLGDYFHSPDPDLPGSSIQSEGVPASLVGYAPDEGPFRAARFAGVQRQWVSLHAQNKITCDGAFPFWTLPSPLTENYYSTAPNSQSVPPIQRLCATALSGGHPSANAGGICLRNQPGVSATVGFSDDWGAGPMLSSQNRYEAMAVRGWCFKRCRCTDGDQPEPEQRISGVLIPGKSWKDDAEVTFGSASVTITPSSSKAFTIKLKGVAGSSRTESSRKASEEPLLDSGDQGTEVFAGDLDKGLAALSTSERATLSNIPQQPQCGGICSSRRDCDASHGREACTCAVDPGSVRKLGLDAVFPAATCIALSLIMGGGSKALQPWGKRELDPSGDVGVGTGIYTDWPCACNSSYVSSACCASIDGVVVHERGKAGILLL